MKIIKNNYRIGASVMKWPVKPLFGTPIPLLADVVAQCIKLLFAIGILATPVLIALPADVLGKAAGDCLNI